MCVTNVFLARVAKCFISQAQRTFADLYVFDVMSQEESLPPENYRPIGQND